MPITLTDRRKERTLEFGDSSVRYVLPSGDTAVAELRRAYSGLTAEQLKRTDMEAVNAFADVRLAAKCVTDWVNVLDSEGQAIPWPDAGRATNAPGRENPEPEALRLREALLANLPPVVFFRIARALGEGCQEAALSGKGLPTG